MFFEVTFFLPWLPCISTEYKSTIPPCMQCCCHVWVGAPSCYLEILDKLKKQTCRTTGPSIAASLKPLAHCRNVVTLIFFYRHYFGRCSSELAQLAPYPYSRGRSVRCSDISVTIPRYYKMSMSKVFSSHSKTLEFLTYKMFFFDL